MTEECVQVHGGKAAGREMIHNIGDVVGVDL